MYKINITLSKIITVKLVGEININGQNGCPKFTVETNAILFTAILHVTL